MDPIRATVKVIESKVRRVCATCCRAPLEPTISDKKISEFPAAPAVLSELQREVVAPPEDQGAPQEVRADVLSRWRRARLRGGAGAVTLAIAMPVMALALARGNSPERTAHAQPARPVSKLLTLRSSGVELVLPRSQALVDGTSWVHPIAGTEEQAPRKRTRLFGAERPGDRPEECGEGHCGVDLDAPRGTPVVAVRPGVIEKVMHDEDASGGRYVWIRHDDKGMRTEYFHFDRVAPDLRAGDEVIEGQWLGTLGRSGIEHSEPHLHFAVRDLLHNSRYIDPLPFLEGAEVMELLDLRLAESN